MANPETEAVASITKTGDNWRARIRRNTFPTISKTFATHAEAKRWAARIEGSMDAGSFVDMSEAQQTTLDEALTRYLAECTPKKRGAKQERNRILAWKRSDLANRPLTSIRSIDIAAWVRAREAEGKAPTTIKNAIGIISQVYRKAAGAWGMEGLHNPVRGVDLPSSRPHRTRRLEGDEETRLLAACDQAGLPWLRSIVGLAIETAMRQGELLNLDRSMIRGNVITLPASMTKTQQERSIPLSSRALALLTNLPASIDGRIFPVHQDQLEYFWRKACRLAGITGLRFHDLRHEAASRLFERGLDSLQVMSITGHTTTAMLKRYTHLRASDLARLLG